MPAYSPRGRGVIAQWIVEYNPFYLLSAACMLFGVFAINDSLDWSPLPPGNLLTMIVTLNVYEFVVIGLAAFLLRRGIRRDALLLLIVEAFFLADVGFLNMEIFAADTSLGMTVNAIVLFLAVVKVAFVFHAAGVPIVDPRFVFVVMQLGVLFAVPGIFALIAKPRDEELPQLAVYAGWCLAGALPVAYAMTVGSLDVFRRRWDGKPADTAMIVSRVLLLLPMLSLLAHLCLANWVYKVRFEPLNLGPLLLGIAVLVGHADSHVTTLATRMRLQLALPLAAVALSAVRIPDDVIFPLARLDFSPLRIALAVAAMVYLDGLLQHRHPYFAWGAGMFLAAAGMGHSVGSINEHSVQMARESATAFDRIVPKTMRQWGFVAIAMAFVLLALGAVVSLMRRAIPIVSVVEEQAQAEESI